MNAICTPTRPALHFQLRFASLVERARALAFTCDAGGRVDLNALDDRARNDYLYARAMVGREFAWPVVYGRVRFSGRPRVRE